MFLDLLKRGLIDKKKLIAEHYKQLGLSENQFAIIILTLELEKSDLKISTPTHLSNYMNIAESQIEHELTDMIEKNVLFINASKTKKYNFDFTPLYNKLAVMLEYETIKQLAENNIESFVEAYFSCKLTNQQRNAIKSYADKNGSVQMVSDYLIKQNFRSVSDFILYLDHQEPNDEVVITPYDWLRD